MDSFCEVSGIVLLVQEMVQTMGVRFEGFQ